MANYKIPWEKQKDGTRQAFIGALVFIIDEFNNDKYVLRTIFRGGVDFKNKKSLKGAKKAAEKVIKARIDSIKDELEQYKNYENS
jgi:hypothetical protein